MAKLCDICEVYSGYALKEFNDSNCGVPVIKIGNILMDGTLSLDNCQYTDENVNEKYHSKQDDIYIALSGATTGKIGQLKTNNDYIINQRVGIVRTKEKSVPSDFIKYYLQNITTQILQDAAGCAQPNISPKQIGNYEIPVLEIDDMCQIAANLDKVTYTIDLCNNILEKLDLLVKSRFVEMFGDPSTNPLGWEKVTIADVCSSIVRGPFGSALKKDYFVEPDETTYKVYEQKHAIQKSITIGTYYITEEKYRELKRFECIAGDIIMSCSGTMGELYQLPVGCERGIINQALCKFTLNERILPIVFLTFMKQTIGNLETKGSGIQNIAAVSYVKAMPVNLPPLDIQQQFAAFVEQTDKSKSAVKQVLEKAETLKKALMQEYFG